MLMICAVEAAGMAIAASADNIQTTRRKRRIHVPLRRRDDPAARYSHDRMMRHCGAQSKKLRRETSSLAGNSTHVVAPATATTQRRHRLLIVCQVIVCQFKSSAFVTMGFDPVWPRAKKLRP